MNKSTSGTEENRCEGQETPDEYPMPTCQECGRKFKRGESVVSSFRDGKRNPHHEDCALSVLSSIEAILLNMRTASVEKQNPEAPQPTPEGTK